MMAAIEHGLTTLVHSVVADGAYGLTLRSGRAPVAHSEQGSHPLERTAPTADELISLLRQLVDSRQMRELRDGGTVSFVHALESGVRLLGGARQEEAVIHVELRRLIDQQGAGGNAQ